MRICTLLFAIVVLLLSSCSVSKRNYMSGYHVEWAGKKSASQSKLQMADDVKSKELPVVYASNNKNLFPAPEPSLEGSKSPPLFCFNCDTLVLRNEAEIKVKVLEIGLTEIKYRYCNDGKGRIMVIPKNEVAYIKYGNGQRETFTVTTNPIIESNKQNITVDPNQPQKDEMLNASTLKKQAGLSLVFGILGFVLVIFYFVGVGFAIAAIVIGKKTLRQLRNYNITDGQQQAKTGMILGIVLLALIALAILAVIVSLFLFLFGII